MVINDPETVAELRELYPRYEQALVSNDVETLISMFWASPFVARFGPTESLYGISEIEAFRKARSPANLARTIKRQEIVAFGKDFASITVAFEREIEGQAYSRPPEPDLGPPSRGMAHRFCPRFHASLTPLFWCRTADCI